MYNAIEEAIHFMVLAFRGQRRKNENIDKSFHSMSVGMMIRNVTETEDVIVAAILHDIINDTEYGYEEIEEKFGTLVADIVMDLSEDHSRTKWLDRKKDFVERMRENADINVINIMVADKLHNLLSDYELFQKMGDKVWKFSKGTKEENSWLYKECYYIAKKKGASEWLLGRYKKVLLEYFGDLDEESI
jgi:myo-inositol-1(or 4)-monophosphatase